MRRAAVATALVVGMVAVLGAPASAATHTVQVVNSAFQPAATSGVAGDVVTWQKSGSGFHNVASNTSMFRSGGADAEPFTFTRTFSAGTYPYRCEVHADFGMTGVVRIRPGIATAPDGPRFTVRWATPSSNTGTVFRVQYRVGSGDWRLWIGSTTDRARVFGASNQPVAVVDNTTYRFRARSTRSGNVSGYSPVTAFTP